jgi:GTPase SAR1 family protein
MGHSLRQGAPKRGASKKQKKKMASSKFMVKRFDLGSFKPDRAILCLGQTGSGKTTLIQHIAHQLFLSKRITFGIAMTPSIDTQEMFRKFLPRCLVRREFNEAVLQALLDHQKDCLERTGVIHKVVVFLDDMNYDKSIFKTKVIRELFMNGRHLGITLVFSMQYMMDVGPDIRGNTGYIFAFADRIRKNRQKLWENYFGMFSTFSGFDKTFHKCTENYECLVMDNTNRNNQLADTVFYFKASLDIPKFKLVSSQFQKLAKYSAKRHGKVDVSPLERAQDVNSKGITEVTKEVPRKQRRKKIPPSVTPFHVDV